VSTAICVVLFDSVNVLLFKSNHSEFDIGGSNMLSCPINHGGPVRWLFVNSKREQQRVIFNGLSVESDYTSRLLVVQTTEDVKLSLHKIQSSDFGWYVCIEDGALHPIKLTEKGN